MAVDDTRKKIVGVAKKLFGRFGFHKTSMDEIARIARKAKGSLYYHFSSKEDLFKEVVSIEINILKEKLSTVIDDPELNASDKLVNYLVTRMQAMNDAMNYNESVKADLYEQFDFVDDLRAEMDVWEKESLKKIITQGVTNNEFEKSDDIDKLLEVIVMVFKGLEVPFFVQGKYGQYSPYLEKLMRIFTSGLSK